MENLKKNDLDLPDGVFESTIVSKINRNIKNFRKSGKKIIDFMDRPDVPSRAKHAAQNYLFSKENSKYTNPRGLEKLLVSI